MEKVSVNDLTALIITYNEKENIGRVLDRLGWLQKVIVVDSYSTDSTVDIIRGYPNTEVFFRPFDTHSGQWNYGLSLVTSEWVLTLDADYILTREFIDETRRLINHRESVAYFTKFRFVVFGKPLRRNNTTRRPVLFQRRHGVFYDDGHTQRLRIAGPTGAFKSWILHDDRKPLTRWIHNLNNYSVKECRKMLSEEATHPKSVVLRIRKTKVLAPFLVFFYCLFVNGALLDGWRGWHYTLQRTLVEILFALRLIEEQELKPQLPQVYRVSQEITGSALALEKKDRVKAGT